MAHELSIGFVGNPNCGKTTLFNAYTGANLKVANWPGVTVEKKEGLFQFHDHEYKLVDLPGTYSLTSYTMEEQVTRQYILSDDVDVIIDVADASALERNLYLTLQLIELGKPVILALNMMDIVQKRGMEIDLHRLPEMLGIPVIPVSARKKKGLDILMHAVIHHKDFLEKQPLIHHHDTHSAHPHQHHKEFVMVYSDEIEDKIDQIIEQFRRKYPEMENMRWHAIKVLEQDASVMENYPIDADGIVDRSYEKDIINEKYDFIEEVIEEVLVNKSEQEARTDRIDRYMTGKWLGLPIFLVIMALVFFLTFAVGDWLKGYFETGLDMLTGFAGTTLESVGVSPVIESLIVDGIISGVGGILTFLPNIFILFLALAFLEDSGYMARVAFVMDKLLRKIGLSGRSIVPMLIGFGCTVPGVMASRTLPSERDRKMTILLTPFMSCSAKLPIYGFFTAAFFPDQAALVMICLYFGGILMGILMAFLLRRTMFSGEAVPFVMELPNYRMPGAKNVGHLLWDKAKDFLQRAFTVIFVATIVIWFLQTFDLHLSMVSDSRDSILALVAGVIAPIFAPMGFGDWRVSTALISGFMAKESVVATLSVLFGSTEALTAAVTPVAAASLLAFCLLYTPCVAAIAAIKRELGGRWAAGVVVMQCIVAWIAAFVVYQVGILL